MSIIKAQFNIGDLNPDWWFDISRTDNLGINQPGNEIINILSTGGSGSFTQSGVGLRSELVSAPANRSSAFFDDSNDQRYLGNGVTSNPSSSFELTAIANTLSGASTRSIFSQEDGTGTGRAILSVQNNGHLTSFLGGNNTTGTTDTVDGKYHVLTYRHNTVTNILRAYVDGALEATQTRNVESATGEWVLGANKNQNANFMDGNVAECFFLNGETSDVIFNAYQRHLCDKWQIEYKG